MDELRARDDVEHLIEAHALLERALRARLDDGAVGQRIGERHADLDDVGAGRLEPLQQRDAAHGIGMTGRDVGNERLAGCAAQLGEAPTRSRQMK